MNFRRKLLILFGAFSASTAGACGDGSNAEPFGMEEQALYRLDSFTDNKTTCTVEGDSALADTGDHLIVFGAEDLTGYALHAHVCADPADCRKNMQAQRTRQGGWASILDIAFTKDAGDHFEGGGVTTGFKNGSVCEKAELTNATLGRSNAGRIRLETRTVITDHAPDADGICWTDSAMKAAMGKPCSRFRVVSGTRVEAL